LSTAALVLSSTSRLPCLSRGAGSGDKRQRVVLYPMSAAQTCLRQRESPGRVRPGAPAAGTPGQGGPGPGVRADLKSTVLLLVMCLWVRALMQYVPSSLRAPGLPGALACVLVYIYRVRRSPRIRPGWCGPRQHAVHRGHQGVEVVQAGHARRAGPDDQNEGRQICPAGAIRPRAGRTC
jgi:hypothetical protein